MFRVFNKQLYINARKLVPSRYDEEIPLQRLYAAILPYVRKVSFRKNIHHT